MVYIEFWPYIIPKSIVQRFPDKIANWKGFKQEVRRWKSESANKYQTQYLNRESHLYDVLSTYDQIWLHVSSVITNTSTDPHYVLKSRSLRTFPIMIADDAEVNENSENNETLFGKINNKEFKYKPNVVTRNKVRQALNNA
ncbi:hypothetical protein Glove_348g31 [Diversispora epigaea]|uniref:Uncharacterized protein n=1 Tax=Diversispora epigaea TaxID=1348612 RepID=A0A397HE31_9GLOM|nr:hypothetical protein Glove_348g31 [Diversispora epigaea]